METKNVNNGEEFLDSPGPGAGKGHPVKKEEFSDVLQILLRLLKAYTEGDTAVVEQVRKALDGKDKNTHPETEKTDTPKIDWPNINWRSVDPDYDPSTGRRNLPYRPGNGKGLERWMEKNGILPEQNLPKDSRDDSIPKSVKEWMKKNGIQADGKQNLPYRPRDGWKNESDLLKDTAVTLYNNKNKQNG